LEKRKLPFLGLQLGTLFTCWEKGPGADEVYGARFVSKNASI
jgi:hypothetical protein